MNDQSSSEQSAATAEQTTVLGGVEIRIDHLPIEAFDEPARNRLAKFHPLFGQSETVKVRQVLVAHRTKYCHALILQDEATQLDVYVEKEPAWFETLTPQSIDAILDRGLEINLDFFGAWSKRQAKVRGQQQPDAITDLQRKLTEMEIKLAALPSTGSASKSPLSTH